jgi:hypothetical protein
MKRKTIIPTRFTSKAVMLSGCMAVALSTVALGQAGARATDHQSLDRTSTPGTLDQQDQHTFEGKLVPLFEALNGSSTSDSSSAWSGSAQDRSTQSGQSRTYTQPGQIGTTTQPSPTGTTRQPGQPGSTTQPGQVGSTQPGQIGSTQPGQPGSRQLGLNESPATIGVTSQPLALVSATKATSDHGATESPYSSGAGRPSTPDRDTPSTTPGLGSSSTTDHRSTGMSDGKLYVLVFDPEDAQSRSAYMLAQSIARSQQSGMSDSIHTSGTIGTTPSIAEGTSAANRQSDSSRDDATHWDHQKKSEQGEKVKVTGRVIEKDGIQAIAVTRVERHQATTPLSSVN